MFYSTIKVIQLVGIWINIHNECLKKGSNPPTFEEFIQTFEKQQENG
jgi:hypothetical protein